MMLIFLLNLQLSEGSVGAAPLRSTQHQLRLIKALEQASSESSLNTFLETDAYCLGHYLGLLGGTPMCSTSVLPGFPYSIAGCQGEVMG